MIRRTKRNPNKHGSAKKHNKTCPICKKEIPGTYYDWQFHVEDHEKKKNNNKS